MVVTVNGEAREVEARTVADLLAEIGFDGAFFAVAVNRAVVRRAAWTDTALDEGDAIEIVTPRQGG